MTNPIVVDLSHWNPTPDWQALKAAGTLGVIHKATEGTSYVDGQYGPRVNAAKAAGLWWASYHFLKHGDTSQMAWYLSRVQPSAGDRLVIDYEDADCTLGDLINAIGYLLDTVPCQVAVYGSSHLSETISAAIANGDDLGDIPRTSLWQARYSSSEPVVPAAWKRWDLWQYTDKAACAGISQPVDGNKWHADAEALALWFSNPPKPQPVAATITMQVAPGTIVVVNGVEVVAS